MNKIITTLIVVGIVFSAGLIVQTSFGQTQEPREPPTISDRCPALTAAHTAVPGAHADAWLAAGICGSPS
jgi:hypothetical protein